MLFFQLFYTFLMIGAFTFGGGYSMVALIEGEVVTHRGWMSAAEFADLLAVSQATPGPVGINTATYAGYTAVLNAGYPQWTAVGGSLLASLAVIVIPVALTILVGGWLMRHKENPCVAAVMQMLRLTAVGLVAAAALGLMPTVFTDTPKGNIAVSGFQLPVFSLVIFLAVFVLACRRRVSPVLLIVASGFAGLAFYSL